MEEKSKNNFFKSVSAYNKERFHSECITWVFNEKEEHLKIFIKKNADCNGSEIKYCRAYSEISQIDILIVYKLHNQDNYKFICIENKVKSEEHFIDSKKSEKCLENLNKEIELDKEKYKEVGGKNVKLSQTEFYFLRLNQKDNIKKIFEKIHSPHLDTFESLHDFLKTDKNYYEKYYTLKDNSNWHFLFLKPGILKIDNEPIEGNTWRVKKMKNPWKNIEYKSLFQPKDPKHIKNDNTILKEYIEYLESEFNPSNEENTKFSSDNIKKALSGELNEFEISILKDYFRNLESDFKESNKIKKEADEIKTAFITDTGNNGGFLFEAYFVKKTPDEIKKCAEDKCQNKFEYYKLGIQYENSRFKLFFAANDYDNVKINESKKGEEEKGYQDLVKKELKRYTDCIKYLFDNNLEQKKFNKNTSKTFCSFTSSNNDKSFSNYYEFKNIFSKSLEHIKDVLNKST